MNEANAHCRHAHLKSMLGQHHAALMMVMSFLAADNNDLSNATGPITAYPSKSPSTRIKGGGRQVTCSVHGIRAYRGDIEQSGSTDYESGKQNSYYGLHAWDLESQLQHMLSPSWIYLGISFD